MKTTKLRHAFFITLSTLGALHAADDEILVQSCLQQLQSYIDNYCPVKQPNQAQVDHAKMARASLKQVCSEPPYDGPMFAAAASQIVKFDACLAELQKNVVSDDKSGELLRASQATKETCKEHGNSLFEGFCTPQMQRISGAAAGLDSQLPDYKATCGVKYSAGVKRLEECRAKLQIAQARLDKKKVEREKKYARAVASLKADSNYQAALSNYWQTFDELRERRIEIQNLEVEERNAWNSYNNAMSISDARGRKAHWEGVRADLKSARRQYDKREKVLEAKAKPKMRKIDAIVKKYRIPIADASEMGLYNLPDSLP